MSDDQEFTAEATKIVTEDTMKIISSYGEEMVSLTAQIEHINKVLEEKKNQLNQIATYDLPDAMDRVNMAMFRLSSGRQINIIPVLAVKVVKGMIDEVDEWLSEHDHAGLVKRQLVVPVPRGDDPERVDRLVNAIKQSGYEVEENKSIHYQTLNKWGREMKENGDIIPTDYFDVYEGRIAKLS